MLGAPIRYRIPGQSSTGFAPIRYRIPIIRYRIPPIRYRIPQSEAGFLNPVPESPIRYRIGPPIRYRIGESGTGLGPPYGLNRKPEAAAETCGGYLSCGGELRRRFKLRRRSAAEI